MGSPELNGQSKGITRREFLGFFGLAAILYGLHSAGKYDHEKKLTENTRNWVPKVADLLNETLQAEQQENFYFFAPASKREFVQLVATSDESILSANPNTKIGPRYNLLAFVLSEAWQTQRFPSYSEDPEAIFLNEDTLTFFNQVISVVGPQTIRSKPLESKANMYIESMLRSYAAAWKYDPTNKEGVLLATGNPILPSAKFIRLQTHS